MRAAPLTLLCLSLMALPSCAENSVGAGSSTGTATGDAKGQVKPGYSSYAGQVLAQYTVKQSARTPADMAKAAQAFLQSLSEDERKIVSLGLRDPERREWTNSPAREMPRGLSLGALSKVKLEAACDLLASVLSDKGYQKLKAVMLGDDLRSVVDGARNHGVGIEDFRIVLFGTPAPGQAWALQLDGHHVALNISVSAQGQYSMSPSFVGTFPRTFKVAGVDYRPLEDEIDRAYELLGSLSPDQSQSAVVAPKRQGLRAGAGQDGVMPEQTGLAGQAMDVKQKTMLLALAERWLSTMPQSAAQETRARLEAEIEETTFSWNGPTEPGSDISFVIQSPTMIFELGNDHRGGAEGSSPVDHVHTMFRDFKREYGGTAAP